MSRSGPARESAAALDRRALLALLLAVATLLAGQPGARTVDVAGSPTVAIADWQPVRGSEPVAEGGGSARVSGRTGERTRVSRDIALGAGVEGLWRLRLPLHRSSPREAWAGFHAATVAIGYLDGGERIGWAPTQRVAPWAGDAEVDVLMRLPRGTDGLRVFFRTTRADTWHLGTPSVRAVRLAPWHDVAVAGLVAGWVVVLGALLLPALRHVSRWRAGAVLLGLAAVVLGTGFSRAAIGVLIGPLAAALGAFVDGSSGQLAYLVQKIGHFATFLALAVALTWCRGVLALRRSSVVLLCLAVAVGTEAMQLYVDGRTPRGSDIAIDLGGVATGLLCMALARAAYRRLRGAPVPPVGADRW